MRTIRKQFFVAALAAAAILAVPAVAQDHGRDDQGRYGTRQDGQNSQAYQAGYHDGMYDMQRHKQSKPNNHRWKSDVDRQAYDTGYRSGFSGNQQPYGRDDHHDRDGRDYRGPGGSYGNGANNGSSLQRIAQQTGVTDGTFYAQQDSQNGRGSNPTGAKGYKDADHNYTSSLGSKGEYQSAYRAAFAEAYQRAYGRGNRR